jgi:cytochrome b
MNGGSILWDLPTRIFHWGIVCCLPLAWLTAELDNYEAHSWIGYTVIVLVVTRVLWGLVGSRHSRFTDFLVGPGGLLAYLRGQGYRSAGHNPLGGLSIVVMLLLLLLQAGSGLFNSDDALFSGPLYYAADSGFRDTMGVVHEVAFNALLALVVLHVGAVLYHQFRLKERLVQAMWWGRAPGREGRETPMSAWLALVLLCLVGGALWLLLEQAPKPTVMW